MDLGLQGRRALVTAASKGLGRACAAALTQEGAAVMIASRTESDLRRAAAEIGAAAWRVADVAEAGQVQQLVGQAAADLGGLDILVCNAGGPPTGVFDTVGEAEWERGYELTFMSAVRLIRAALPHLRASDQARIVIITSITARQPIDGLILSNAFRPALTGMAKTLSREIAPEGITVNCIAPDAILSDRIRELSGGDEPSGDHLPVRRMGRPEEVGALCAYLCSAEAGFVTGQTVSIDGGSLRGIH